MFIHTIFIFIIIFTLIPENNFSFNRTTFTDFSNTGELFYQSPLLNIAKMNLTIGLSIPFYRERGAFDYESYSGLIIGAICQADQINQGLYDEVNFTGTINMAIQYYLSSDDLGQKATFDLLQSSIFNSTTNEPLSDNDFQIGGFIGTYSSGVNRVNSALLAGFAIPYMNPGSLNQISQSDNYAVVSTVENRTYFEVRSTKTYDIVDAVIGLMASYNWTIGTNVYQNNVLGLASQQAIQAYVCTNSVPIFTCETIISDENIDTSEFYTSLCDCMTKIDVLTVINLWTTQPVAYIIIKKMRQICSAADKFVFIVTGDNQPLPPAIFDNDTDFKSVLLFRPFGPLNFGSYLNNCIETGTPPAKSAIKSILADTLAKTFNCFEESESTASLPKCNDNIYNRPVPCICTGLEFDPRYNPYSVYDTQTFIHELIIF